MNYTPPTPSPGTPGGVVLPVGWRAEWSAQYGRHFYVNNSTNESTWTLPTPPPMARSTHSIKRKPIPGQASPSPSQNQASTPMTQKAYVEAYPTPPPQVTTGYFPAVQPAQQQQQQQQQQSQYTQLPEVVQQQSQPQNVQPQVSAQQQVNPHQQYPQVARQPQAQPQYAETQKMVPPQFVASPSPQQPQVSVPQQGVYSTPSATPVNTSPQYFQQPVQTFSPPPTPGSQPYNNYAKPAYSQPQTYPQNVATPSPAPFAAQPNHQQQYQQQRQQQPVQTQVPQQFAQVSQPQQQQRQQQQQQYQQPQQQQQQYQQQPYQNQNQNQTQSKRTSMIPTSLAQNPMMTKMAQNPMMSKMSTKFSTAKPADWKKWGKRAAIGVAGIGALALGADAAGDMFEGGGGMDFSGGGEDLSGGGFESGGGGYEGGGAYEGGYEGSGQEAVDAAYAQAAIEQQGQQNALMLLDPVGTTYTFESAAQTQGTMGLI